MMSEGRKEGRKEEKKDMFYLTMHSIHILSTVIWSRVYTKGPFIEIGNVMRERERNVLFNDALDTFLSTVIWRQTYGKGPF